MKDLSCSLSMWILSQVSVEHCPSEVYIHVSPTKCWEMVRERVNQEIARQHRMRKSNLPPLLPPGSLDGFEMFGFSSPAVVQVNAFFPIVPLDLIIKTANLLKKNSLVFQRY